MRAHRYRLLRSRPLSTRIIRNGLIAFGLILLIDVFTIHFSAQIQTVLTVPTGRTTVNVSRGATGTHSLAMASQSILAQDTFQRPNQLFWGTASDGQRWSADAISSQSFAIINHSGQVANGNGIYDATIGPHTSDSEVMFSGLLNHFASASIGALLRWTDANNLYKAYLDGTHLILLKKVAGNVTVLKTVAFAAQDGVLYSFRFRVVGSLLSAKVWPTDQVEPAGWMITAIDNALGFGYGGLRVVVQSTTNAVITSFTELKA
jgi:hypothetical protein